MKTTKINDIGIVYKWINLINNKYYIGSHCGSENDGYLASGKIINKAFKRYGIENFKRIIIYTGPDYREIEELCLITLDCANDCSSYNLKNAAIGGDVWVGRKDTEEYKEYLLKISNPGVKNGMYEKKHTEEIRKIISDKTKGRIPWNKGKTGIYSEEVKQRISRKGFKFSEESKKRMSLKRSNENNANAKSITIEGITYLTLKEAEAKTGLSQYKLRKMLKSK